MCVCLHLKDLAFILFQDSIPNYNGQNQPKVGSFCFAYSEADEVNTEITKITRGMNHLRQEMVELKYKYINNYHGTFERKTDHIYL